MLILSLIVGVCLINKTFDFLYADKYVEQVDNVCMTECVVTECNNTIITPTDVIGNDWQVDNDRYNKGDVIIAWIDSNNTVDDVTDDVIIKTCSKY